MTASQTSTHLTQWINVNSSVPIVPLGYRPHTGARLHILHLAGKNSKFDMALQSGRTYKLVNGKAGTVLDLSGAENRQTVGYGYHGGDNQKVRG